MMSNNFAKNLKYIRKKKNIDQQVMAEDLGVAQSTLSCWESGIRTPNLDMVAKIAEYLQIDKDFITNDFTQLEKNINTKEYEELINKYDKLSGEDKELINNLIDTRLMQKKKDEVNNEK